MAKIIRFPLIVADGYPARSLEELREHFSLEKVLEYYYKDQRLLTWLEHRGLEDEAEEIRALDENAVDFQLRLCEIFQVEYTGTVDEEELRRRIERLNRVKALTDETEHHKNAELVAFNQEELAELVLDEGETKVYLCQEEGEDFTFTIPGSRSGVTYIGIPCKGRNPRVRVSGHALDRLEELKIDIQSCEVEKQEQDEAEEIQIGPFQEFLDVLSQKASWEPDTGATVTARLAGTGQLPPETTITGNVEALREKAALFIQEALANQNYVAGIELSSFGIQCTLRLKPESIAMGRVKGVHIDRENDGTRKIYVDLLHPVKLNHRKYRSIQILSAKVYRKLDLLEGSEIEIYCFGDMLPVIRVDERGNGRTLRCPYCGSRFQIRDGLVFCENPVCFDRLHGRIFRFLEAIGLETYDRTFVQTLITELPVNSFKDLFEIDSDMLELHGIMDENFKAFPDALCKAVSTTDDHIILGKLGVPALGVKRAGFLTKKYRAEAFAKKMGVWDYVLSELDELWDKNIEAVIEKEHSDNIQRWLRCDRYAMKIFRDDILEISKHICMSHEENHEVRQFLTRGAYVGIDNEVIYADLIKNICRREGFHCTGRGGTDWSKMNVLISDPGSQSKIALFARRNDIPVFTATEFVSDFAD